MSFLPAFREVLHVGEVAGPAIATAMNPAAGALVSVLVDAVTKAEQAGGTGVAKKEQVMQDVLPAAAAIVNATLHARGIDVSLNASQLSSALTSLVDGVVALLNAVEKPQAAGTATTAATPAAATAAS